MLAGLDAFNGSFLADLNNTENRISQVNKQITSGFRVNEASDDPAAIAAILGYQNQIEQTKQTQTNLNLAATVATSADGALSSVSSLLNQLISIAAQGSSSTVSAATRSTLATQVESIAQTLVGIANTTVQGQYIFGGDAPGTQPYTFSTPDTFSTTPNNLNSPTALFDVGTPGTDSESFKVTYTDSSGAVQNTIVSVAATATGITGSTFASQINSALTTSGVTGIAAQIGADGTLQLTGSNLVAVIHTLTPGVTQGVAANNASLTRGVVQNNTAAATATIANAAGSTIVPGQTAQQIFDVRNPDGTLAAGNIFQNVYALGQALQNNDQTATQAAAVSLQSSVSQLAQATTSNGNTEAWIQQANTDASSTLTNLQGELSSLRDTDVAAAATQLTTDQTALQAALTAHASLTVKSLFSYLG